MAFFCSNVMPFLFLIGLRVVVGVALGLIGTRCGRGEPEAGNTSEAAAFFVRVGAMVKAGRDVRSRGWEVLRKEVDDDADVPGLEDAAVLDVMLELESVSLQLIGPDLNR